MCKVVERLLKKVGRYKEKHWDVQRLYGSGGMSSSHSATVMGLASAIDLCEGPASPLLQLHCFTL
jgi:acid phosphatase family membrane protein YuiD